MRILATITCLIISFVAQANLYLKIGLMQFDNPQSAIVTPSMGSYEVICDDSLTFTLSIGEIVKFTRFNDSLIQIQNISEIQGAFKKIRLIGNNLNNKFKVRCIIPNLKTASFNGDLSVSILNQHLQFITNVDIENYVPKVVEAEAGTSPGPEYLKLQAIICRTYAISNLKRHELDGFQLCDKVHCQVYKGNKRVNEKVMSSSKSTEGQIIVDENLETINATFHSNCGGHTLNSEDVWTAPRTYLKARKDQYCKSSKHSNWKKEIPKQDLINFYSNLFNEPIKEKDLLKYGFNTLADTRKPNYSFNNKIVPVTDVRRYFGLNSTKFKITKSLTNTNNFLITGQGFGHRVGMCQEGAMEMAKQNIHYTKILDYYFQGVQIIYYRDQDFLE